MTIATFFLAMTTGVPAITVPVAIVCDTILLTVAMLMGVIH